MFKKVLQKTIHYLTIAIPMSTFLLMPIYLYGNELGIYLIEKFGNTIGLYIRPLALGTLCLSILSILLLPKLQKLNEALWPKKFSYEEIIGIYKTYIYSLSSFIFLSLLVVIITIFSHSQNSFNWFNFKDYLFIYLIAILLITPALAQKINLKVN